MMLSLPFNVESPVATYMLTTMNRHMGHTCLKKSMMAPLGEVAAGLAWTAGLVGEVGDILLPLLLLLWLAPVCGVVLDGAKYTTGLLL